MRHPLVVACLALAVSGFAASRVDAQWRNLGLIGYHVHRLSVHEGYVYACTKSGLHRRSLASSDTNWEWFGFSGPVLDVVGIGPSTLLAAKQLTSDPGDTVSMFRCNTNGPPVWEPFQNGFGSGGTSARQARRLLPLSGFPGTILATSGRIEKSTDYGASWRVVLEPGALINAIEQSPVSPGLIWMGGETNIFAPYVSRSSDGGETWATYYPFAGGDNAVNAIAPHPAASNAVYLGMEGRVMTSDDGGTTWWTMTSPNPANYTFGLVARPYMPLKLYAAGASFSIPTSVMFYTSLTGGLTWETSSFPGHPGNGVYHLLEYVEGGSEILFIATGNGVYSFTETPTGVPISEEARPPALSVGPNPFRRSTEIEFALSAREAVSLKVVDVRGRVVATLVHTTLEAGPHRLMWNADDLPAGIYFARFRAGGHEESVKLLHFR